MKFTHMGLIDDNDDDNDDFNQIHTNLSIWFVFVFKSSPSLSSMSPLWLSPAYWKLH